MKKDLFDLSIPTDSDYANLLVKRPDYQKLVTFAQNKREPIYNWFYYKEGFSRGLVWGLLDELKIPNGSTVLDPFCGTGTTLLACRQLGYNTIGFDTLPLAVFVSDTKLQTGYNIEKLHEKIVEISNLKFGQTTLKWPDLKFINLKRAFSRYARNDILFFKEQIMEIQDQKIRNFILLGLISIITQASNTKKDGGVVKIVKKKHTAPVRHLLKNKLKRMYKDLKKANYGNGTTAEVHLADARSLPTGTESADACITSPPYLNFVDYTKLYAIELSLLVGDSNEISRIRKGQIRSHLGSTYEDKGRLKSKILVEALKIADEASTEKIPIVRGYFEDMFDSMERIYKVLKDGAHAAIVVGNACMPGITVDVDLILTEFAEQIGFKPISIWVANARWCEVYGIKKERPVRESVIILKK